MDQPNTPRPGDPGLKDGIRISFPEIPGFRESVLSIVREEIVRVFQALGREASHLDAPYETAELDSRALSNIMEAAERTVRRLTCPHERYSTSVVQGAAPYCARCGEPEAMPDNPFKED